MNDNLIQKLKKSRETNVEAGGFDFTIRRPTDMEIVELNGKTLQQGDILERFVTNWSGIQEIDIIPGGTTIDVPFSTGLFMEWVADKPELWAPLIEAITGAYESHQKALEETLGKPKPG